MVVTEAARASNLAMISEFAFRNAEALRSLVDEHGIQLRQFPDDVMAALHESSQRVLQQQVENDEASKRIFEAYRDFQQRVSSFTDIGELAYLKSRETLVG